MANSTPKQPEAISLSVLPPLSLYIHFPWCMRKCPYCDFNSFEAGSGLPEDAYLDALRADLEYSAPLVWGRRILTVFIGGGTPSLLSSAGMDRLLTDVRSLLQLDPMAEITMEANPGTFEAEKFQAYRESGINRLSIGIQSFNAQHLQAIGRVHDGDEARRAIGIAQKHFDNINLDLMYALPLQTVAQAHEDIKTAVGFGPQHLSLYHLTLEPNTYFAKYPPEAMPDEEESADMQQMIWQETADAGYQHYEVSAYAQPGRHSKHNLNYWQFGDYLGIGSGAHAKISFPDRIIRQMRYMQPAAYMKHALARQPVHQETALAPEDLGFEFMLNALRLNNGFETRLFSERTGLSLDFIEKKLRQAKAKGLLCRDSARIWPSELGRQFLNDLQELFLMD